MPVISVRTDPEFDADLEVLGEEYGSTSNTIKVAIHNLAEERRRRVLREETLALANNPDDQAEIRAVMAEMDELRAW